MSGVTVKRVDQVYYDGAWRTVKRAFVNSTASQTDVSVVAAVAGKRIVVLGLTWSCITTATAVTLNTKGSGAGVALTPAMYTAANTTLVIPPVLAHVQTNVGEALTMTTSAGNTNGLFVLYVEV